MPMRLLWQRRNGVQGAVTRMYFMRRSARGLGRESCWMGASTTVGQVPRRKVVTSVSIIGVRSADAGNEVASKYLQPVRRLPGARVESSQKKFTAGRLYSDWPRVTSRL